MRSCEVRTTNARFSLPDNVFDTLRYMYFEYIWVKLTVIYYKYIASEMHFANFSINPRSLLNLDNEIITNHFKYMQW